MSDQVDPRFIEIEILTDADRAFVQGGGSYQYRKVKPSGAIERQRDEATLGLIYEGALVHNSHVQFDSHMWPPQPTYVIEVGAEQAIIEFNSSKDIIPLRITQRGRLRLFRLRDEILQRDRIRDDFNVLWAHRHLIPDLTVRLRFRQPSEPLSLIVLDVDHLKKLNDELGHPGADQVLVGIFEIFRDMVRPHEGYRIGHGDEAGAILPGVTLDMAAKLAEEIRVAVEGQSWPGLTIKTKPTVSIGVGTYTSDKPIAAKALYAAVDAIAAKAKKTRNKIEAATVPPA